MMDDPTPDRKRSRLRRALRRTVTAAMTLGVAGAAAGGIVAGRAVLEERAGAAVAPAPAPVTTVRPARIAIEDGHAVPRRFTGQFEPPQEAPLAFEEGGTIDAVFVSEGDAVRPGDVVARLDTRLLRAERGRLTAARDAMASQVDLARRTDRRQAELRERGFATDQTVDETSLGLMRLEATLAETEAAIRALDVRLEKTEIVAPFDGHVGERLLDAGTVAAAGSPVVTLLEGGPVRFRAGIAPDLAETLDPGDEAVIETDGRVVPATVIHLAPDLDAATRARTVVFELPMMFAATARATGTVVLTDRAEGRGAWVPMAALRAGPRGTWQILTVADGAVGVEAAEVVAMDGDRAFVRGTFADGTAYLPDGTHRVVPGETVTVAGIAR